MTQAGGAWVSLCAHIVWGLRISGIQLEQTLEWSGAMTSIKCLIWLISCRNVLININYVNPLLHLTKLTWHWSVVNRTVCFLKGRAILSSLQKKKRIMIQFETSCSLAQKIDKSEVVIFGQSEAFAAIHENLSRLTADSLSSQQPAIWQLFLSLVWNLRDQKYWMRSSCEAFIFNFLPNFPLVCQLVPQHNRAETTPSQKNEPICWTNPQQINKSNHALIQLICKKWRPFISL